MKDFPNNPDGSEDCLSRVIASIEFRSVVRSETDAVAIYECFSHEKKGGGPETAPFPLEVVDFSHDVVTAFDGRRVSGFVGFLRVFARTIERDFIIQLVGD